MRGESKSLIEIYEENIAGIEANLASGKGSPKKQGYRRCALARLKHKLEQARAGNWLPTYAEKTEEDRRRADRLYAIW